MESLHGAIREFIEAIANPYDVSELLHRLVAHATKALDATGAGIMLEHGPGELRFAAASSDHVTRVERRQDELHSGPCYKAFIDNRTVVVRDLREADTWPRYTREALSQRLVAVLGAPMRAHGRTIGVLNVYRNEPTHWSQASIEAAEILAMMGAGYVLHAGQLHASRRLTRHLRLALDSRAVIERAKGMLMARDDIDADLAFEQLRKVSMDTNRKLRDVARDVVEAGGMLPIDPPASPPRAQPDDPGPGRTAAR